ncbi:MAG: hypothetical protein KatS3mg085_309 [Candidatus Dojkabacteria bacterium]|nr:MAG: hypothetical protein KatS3mg085_309 [Candidatus Dojkabacteria bacterium]
MKKISNFTLGVFVFLIIAFFLVTVNVDAQGSSQDLPDDTNATTTNDESLVCQVLPFLKNIAFVNKAIYEGSE